MLDKNQVENLDDFSRQVITAYDKTGNLVTLTRADGTEFKFTVAESDGTEGIKGDTGDIGDRGLSAFESYKSAGRTTAENETEWIHSLKGETGDKGAPGANGRKGDTGIAGISPTFEVGSVTTLSPDADPTASLEKSGNTYKIHVGIPRGNAGAPGSDGTIPSLSIGTVTTIANNGAPSLTITKNGDNYLLNLGIPRGATGQPGTVVTGQYGTEPTVNFSVSMGTVAAVTKTVDGTNWTINLTVPAGAKGDAGNPGPDGANGNSLLPSVPIYIATTSSNSNIVNKPLPASVNGTSSNGVFFGMIGRNMLNERTGFGMSMSWGSTYYYAAFQWCVLGLAGTEDVTADHLSRGVINNKNYFYGLSDTETISHGWFYV